MKVNDTKSDKPIRRISLRRLVGRIISGLAAFPFGMGAAMKLIGGPRAAEMMSHLGIPSTLVVPMSILELTCLVIYLIPATAVLGAVLLTGYLGGAICSHLRVGDPFIVPGVLGGLVWMGIYLRDDRLRAVLPLRRGGKRNSTDGVS